MLHQIFGSIETVGVVGATEGEYARWIWRRRTMALPSWKTPFCLPSHTRRDAVPRAPVLKCAGLGNCFYYATGKIPFFACAEFKNLSRKFLLPPGTGQGKGKRA